MRLRADVQDIADGTSVTIKIVDKDDDGNDDDVATLTASVKESKIACNWKVIYIEDDDDSNSEREKTEKDYTLPKYTFTAECDGVTSEESGRLDVFGWIKTQILDKKTGEPVRNMKYFINFVDGSKILGKTDNDGFIIANNIRKKVKFIFLEF